MADKAAEAPTAPPNQQGMPEAPPSYEATMSGAAGGFVVPPGDQDQSNKGPYQAAPPPQQQQQQPGPGGQTVIVQYMNPPAFGHSPVNMVCPHCQAQIRTTTDSEPGPLAWILAGVMCVVGLWMCACIPCCMDSLNSVTHKCPNCKNFLGRYKGGL